jgi:uncharacterized protein with FMN-binding domain
MKAKKRIIGIFIAFILILVGLMVVYLYKVYHYRSTVKSMTYSDVDISTIPDGTYEGDCNVDFIYAKVSVTVKAGVISSIDLLEHKNERGKPAESILKDIVEQQEVDVDAVSGATNSSKVIKKAVENALLSAKN